MSWLSSLEATSKEQGGTVVHSHLLDMHYHLMLAESSRRCHHRRVSYNFGHPQVCQHQRSWGLISLMSPASMPSPPQTRCQTMDSHAWEASRGNPSKLSFARNRGAQGLALWSSPHRAKLTDVPPQRTTMEDLTTRLRSHALRNVTKKSAGGAQTSTSMSQRRMMCLVHKVLTSSSGDTEGRCTCMVVMSTLWQNFFCSALRLRLRDRMMWPLSRQDSGW
jgi:hypothetical protein